MEGQPPPQPHQQIKQKEIKMTTKRHHHQRLQMIASYEKFHPQVIACSDQIPQLLLSSSRNNSGKQQQHTTNDTSKQQQSRISSSSKTTTDTVATASTTTTSLGAIAGSDGIIVFRWDEPHIPMLVLSYNSNNNNSNTNLVTTTTTNATSNSSRMGGITSLAFSPSHRHIDQTTTRTKSSTFSSSIYLAAVRGSSILIWDVTGHTIQPLVSRLGMSPSGTSSVGLSSTITSMTWITIPNNSSTTNLHIAATTASMAGIWDLGSLSSGPSSSGINSNYNSPTQRPYVRFADASKYQEHSPYIQIVCCNSTSINGSQCAILSMSGMVRIYNLHVTTTANAITIAMDHPIHQLEACHSAGIGLSYIALRKNSTCHNGWVTWGFDASNTDPIVKVWMDYSNVAVTKPIKGNDDDDSRPYPPDYRLIGQCTTPNLACTRVCPFPINNTIVTVSFNDINEGVNSLNWRSDVWRLEFNDNNATDGTAELIICDSNDNSDNDVDYGLTADSTLEHIIMFNGPSDEDNLESALVGIELLPLRAAELNLIQSSDKLQNSKNELILCCLTENGFLTTHVRTFWPIYFNDHLFNLIFFTTDHPRS